MKRGDIIERDFQALRVLDVTENTIMAETMDGQRVAIENTTDLNILESKEGVA